MKDMNDLKDRLGRRHLVCRLAIMLLLLATLLPADLWGQFAGGSGTESDPFQVATAEHLDQVRNYLDAYFIQTADIDLGVAPWNEGEGWLPIGDNSNGLTGKYDGNYKVITGLTINRPESSISVALFSYLKTGGQILNLGVTNVQIIGKGTVGSLVGFAFNGTIRNCYSSGTLLGESKVGGLVAHNGGSSGLIANSFSTADISATSYFADMGGLVGQNNTARIEDSYSHGNVYHSGETISTTSYGGFLGSNVYSGTVVRSYSTGQVKQDDVIATDKGFCGRYETGYMANNFWDMETSGASTTAGTASGKTSAEMKTQSTYTDANWDFATKWAIYPGMYEGYPFHLWYDTPPFVADFSASLLTGLAPLTVQFTDLSTGNPTGWSWDFDTDGTEDASSQNPQFTYNNPGTYTVTLTISSSTATDTLIRTAYITVIDAGNAIVSTTAGGNWTDASTWIDGVVPATDDDVIIQGPVIVNASRTCNNLTVLETGLLENGSNYITLTVKGIINNQGVIRRASSYWLSVKAHKDIHNSGNMSFRELQLAGEVDQTLYQNGNGFFSMNMMSLLDTSNNVYSGSELIFSKTDISLNRGRFILNHKLNLTDGAKLRYVHLDGQDNELSFTKNAGLDQYAVISHAVLTDTVKILGSSVSLADGVVNAGVIENSQSYLTLDVIGDLQNEGVIRSVSPYWLMVKAFRDIYNSGDVSVYELQLAGEVDQTLYLEGDGLFSMSKMSLLDTSNHVYSGSELTFSKTDISLNRGRFILNHKLNLTHGAKLRYVHLDGQDNEVSFTKNAGLDQYAVISHAVLTDTVKILGSSVSLADGVVNTGVIENSQSYLTLDVIGDLQNEGVIRSVSPYWLMVKAFRDIYNSGEMSVYELQLAGEMDQTLYLEGDGLFSMSKMSLLDTSNHVYSGSELTFSKTDISLNSGRFILNHNLNLIDGAKLRYVHLNGQNNELSFTKNAGLDQYAVISHAVLTDTVKILYHMVSLADGVVNAGVIENGNSYYTLNVIGDLQNEGTVRNASPYSLTISLKASLMNSGSWTPSRTNVEGAEAQIIGMVDGVNLGSDFYFYSDVTGSSYQWKKDGQDISGATSSSYKLTGLTQADYGLYVCDVAGQMSRSVEVRRFGVAADFVADPLKIQPSMAVNFMDLSVGNPTWWNWTFGDGQGSTEQNPVHVYDDEGLFNVTLIAGDETYRDTLIREEYISVFFINEPPLPFSLIYPEDHGQVHTRRPAFYWRTAHDVDQGRKYVTGYRHYLADNEEMSDPLVTWCEEPKLTLENDLNEDVQYWWKVEAVDDGDTSTFSETRSFFVNASNSAPEPFALISPLENEETGGLPALLWHRSWDKDPGDVISYSVCLGTSIQDMTEIYTGSDTSFTLTESLNENTRYFWRVNAVDLSGAQRGNMNEAGSFIVNSENDAPLPFELITPTPLSVEVTLTPLFYWEKSIDPDILDEVHYKLYLSPDSLFTDHTPVVLDTNAWVSHELADNGTYFWKVEALDDHGAVAGSPTLKFWTNMVMEPPLPFALLSPDNQATNIPLTPEFIWEKAVDPDPNDYAQYEILVASDSLFEDVVFSAFTARDTSYTPETELDDNRVYFWKIIATGMDSLSAESPVFSFVTTTLSIWDKLPIPEEFTLHQNYPNPFNPTTTIAYGVPEAGEVKLDIYDITGRHIIQLVNGENAPGWHTINWNCTSASGQALSSGVYIYRLTAPDVHLVKKMMFLK